VVDLSEFLAFPERFARAVRGGIAAPTFAPDGKRLCFAEGAPDHTVIWEVELATGTKRPLIDNARLRAALEGECGYRAPFAGLPFSTFEFRGDSTIRFSVERQPDGLLNPAASVVLDPDARTWVLDFDLETEDLRRVPAVEIAARRRAVAKNVRKGVLASDPGPSELPSPDGVWLLGEQGPNLSLRAVSDDRVVLLTTTGTDDHPWSVDGAMWSPDSCRVSVTRADTRPCRRLPIVNWLKVDEEVTWLPFSRVGEPLATMAGAVIDVRLRQPVTLELPGEHDQMIFPAGWRHDGQEAYFLTTDRRQKYLRLYAVDAATGESRLVCEERQDTFILGIRGITRFSPQGILRDDSRLLWFSERDGWRHLYLYGTDGVEIGQVTSGEFETLDIVAVDLDGGTLVFTAHSDLDRPYDVHLCRVGLDGTGFAQLTQLPGVHNPIPGPGLTHFVDVHSAIDRPPATDLLTCDGLVVTTLAAADVSGLADLPLAAPQPFTALAADGETVLYGVLYTPPDFDPSEKYPVIEEIYGGPQIAVQQVGFADGRGVLAMAKAAMGFVVYTVDGRGTPERGKAFQDVVYGRFHEFHVEDHRHVLEQLLERHPFMDGTRVGVTGGSWGGYNTVRTLVLAPEQYHVGAAVCPVYDLEDHAALALEPYMGLPVDRPDAFRAGSSLVMLDRLVGKLLMIHGTSDVNATFSATMKMCDALARFDKEYDLVVLPGSDHHFVNGGVYNQRFAQAAVMRHFIKHLSPRLPANMVATGSKRRR